MAKRDPEKTARNVIDAELTEELNKLLPKILKITGIESQQSLHGKIGGKFASYIDIKNEVILSPEHFITLWLEGFRKHIIETGKNRINSAEYETYSLLQENELYQKYLFIFLKRTYIRNYDALSRKRPKLEESEIWIGQENANYGILITPRFRNGKWENDNSEIRHFPYKYWSIGHILHTGLLIPNKNEVMKFTTAKDYLNFFRNVLIRNSGSKYELEISEHYSNYVLSHDNQLEIPLLIPEFRYDGISKKHKYRLDFTIIEPEEFNKIGFELSPWSSHGYLRKIKELSEKDINIMAKDNFEREMRKHKDFFRKHNIFSLIYTDEDLVDTKKIFEDMRKYLIPKNAGRQLQFHILKDFFQKKDI